VPNIYVKGHNIRRLLSRYTQTHAHTTDRLLYLATKVIGQNLIVNLRYDTFISIKTIKTGNVIK